MKHALWFLPLLLLALLFQYAVLWPAVGGAWCGAWHAVWGAPTTQTTFPTNVSSNAEPPLTVGGLPDYAITPTDNQGAQWTDQITGTLFRQYPNAKCKTGEIWESNAYGDMVCVKPKTSANKTWILPDITVGKPFPTGSHAERLIPCKPHTFYLDTEAETGKQLYTCTQAEKWALVPESENGEKAATVESGPFTRGGDIPAGQHSWGTLAGPLSKGREP